MGREGILGTGGTEEKEGTGRLGDTRETAGIRDRPGTRRRRHRGQWTRGREGLGSREWVSIRRGGSSWVRWPARLPPRFPVSPSPVQRQRMRCSLPTSGSADEAPCPGIRPCIGAYTPAMPCASLCRGMCPGIALARPPREVRCRRTVTHPYPHSGHESPSLACDLMAGNANSGVVETDQLVEAIARRVVELLRAEEPQRSTALVDATAVARDLEVERDWVYSHAVDLGAIRLGGPRGRLRFDLQVVRERLADADPLDWRPPRRAARRSASGLRGSGALTQKREVESSKAQRRASGRTPARSPDTINGKEPR